MWDTPLSPGRWVHMLEHGAVAVLYRPDLCDATCVQQLGAFYDAAPRSTVVAAIRHLVVPPSQRLAHAAAALTYGRGTLGKLRTRDVPPYVIARHRDRVVGASTRAHGHKPTKPRSASTVRSYLATLSVVFSPTFSTRRR